MREVRSLPAFLLMSKLHSRLQYNKAKDRFFVLLLVLSIVLAALVFIIL